MTGCFVRARATAAISRSVMVSFAPLDFSTVGPSRLCAAINSRQSTSRVKKKCGTVVQLCVIRSAISRAIWLSDSPACAPDDEAGDAVDEVGADFFAFAAACTSSAVIVPSGPLPLKPPVSTANSFASRRAFGEICDDVCVAAVADAAPLAAADAARSAAGATLVALAEGAATAFSAGAFSPAATSHAIFSPRQQLSGFLRHFKRGHYYTDSHKFFGGLDGPSVRSGDALPFCAVFHHFHNVLTGSSFALASGGQRTVHSVIVRARNH